MIRPRAVLLRFRRWLYRSIAFLLVVVALIWALAPQFFVLVPEGFPQPVWPAPGRHALVAGVSDPTQPPAGVAPPHAAQIRFAQSDGRALLVENAGRLTIEAYGAGLDRETRPNSYSLVKGLVGALVLRGVADGKIASLDTPVRTILGPDAPDITVKEALLMTSGLAPEGHWDKPVEDAGFSPFGPLARIHAYGVDDSLAQLHVDEGRRGHFSYQSANTAILGRLLERVYDLPLEQLLSEMIWKPAGAAGAHWRQYPDGSGVSAYCCLCARPLDWMRVGRFLMDNGTADQPFLPSAMWQEFIMPPLPTTERAQGVYGLHVRHDVLDRAEARTQGPFAYFLGHGGQVLYILPDQNSIVVRFGAHQQLLHSTLYELFED